jgi:hypothetical protein
MKKMTRVSILMVAILSLSFIKPVFASDPYEIKKDSGTKIIAIDKTLMNISSSDMEEYKAYGKNLAEVVQASNENAIDEAIKSYCSSHTNAVFESVQKKIIDSSLDQNDSLTLKASQRFIDTYENTYVLDKGRTLTITPSFIVLEILRVTENPQDELSMQTTVHSKSGISEKTYYGISGNKAFSLAVESTFNYNGSTAWYKSGFNYYYTKGTLSVWQVSNWNGWKEASGTSYKAYCAGNFHWGIEYAGSGLVIQDYYCKNTLICDKDGNISTSAVKK